MGGDAGVEDRHHDAAAIGDVPGEVSAGAGGGAIEAPLLRIAGVVRRQGVVVQAVDFDVLDVGILGELLHQGQRTGSVQALGNADHLGAEIHVAHMAERKRIGGGSAQHGLGAPGGVFQRTVERGLAARLGGAVAIFHDEAIEAAGRLQATGQHAFGGDRLGQGRGVGERCSKCQCGGGVQRLKPHGTDILTAHCE